MRHETLEQTEARRTDLGERLAHCEPVVLEARSKYSKVWLARKQRQLDAILVRYGTLRGDDVPRQLAALQAVEQVLRDDISLLENAKKYKEDLAAAIKECDNTIESKKRERSLQR